MKRSSLIVFKNGNAEYLRKTVTDERLLARCLTKCIFFVQARLFYFLLLLYVLAEWLFSSKFFLFKKSPILITKCIASIKTKFPFLWPAIRGFVILGLHQLSRFKILRILREKKVLFLELGAGNKKGAGNWVTIDISKHCDIFWDLTCGIPFPDKSVSKIYSSHFLEHLSFEDGQRILDECKRVLIDGGIFSISVPNARIFLEAYVHSRSLDQNRFHFFMPAFNNTTGIDYANYTAYMEGRHKYMFDEENMIFILNKKGFKNVRLREFDPSIDLEIHAAESIYAEAVK